MIEFIDLGAQQKRIRESVERRIRAVLDHGTYIMGPEVEELERKLAEFSGARHCLSCANGTDALLLALMAYGVGPGDAVFVPSFTFMATAEVVALLGATPVFVDSEERSYNLSPPALERAIATRCKGLRPRGVIPVDLFGLPADYDAIGKIAAQHGLFVLQDAAQSYGASYHGARVGTQGQIAATSFFPAKPLGCYGDGGAIFTDDDHLAELMRSMRVHGKGADKYDNVRVGLNARLDTIQAAVLLAKLEIFEDEVLARGQVAARYSQGLRGTAGLTLPFVPGDRTSVWAQYSIVCETAELRTRVMGALQKAGIPAFVYYPKPLHLQTAYSGLGYRGGDLPVAEGLSGRIFSLPMHPYLTEGDQERVVSVVRGL